MSGSVNKVTLVGNLGQDPEVRTMQNGSRVVTMSIATSESWKDPHNGERRERTEWHRVVVWNEGLGKIAEKFLVKGSKVYVEGVLRTRKFTDKQGTERYSTEIHLSPYAGTITFLDRKREDANNDREHAVGSLGSASPDFDDDVPF